MRFFVLSGSFHLAHKIKADTLEDGNPVVSNTEAVHSFSATGR